jgi:hypothetical protein
MHQKPIFTVILAALLAVCDASGKSSPEQAAGIVAQIQRADYEGDRATLKKCYNELTPFLENDALASRVRYWRGFDLWRRAINGFNDSVDPKELEQDLRQAINEFKAALQKDQTFVDAKIGMISCLGYLAFMKRTDAAALQDLLGQISPLVKEAKAMAPDNPRLHWVLGPILNYQAHESGSGPEKMIENYQTGLQHCSNAEQDKNSLEPSWGKPELLVSLAYMYLNGNPPNPEAAETNARSALEIVPYWHYTRDILLPQILAAKAKTK